MKSHIQRAISFLIIIATVTCIYGQTEWTTRTSGTLENLQSIVWTGEQLVTVGDSGVILTSEDGAAWENCSSGVNKDLSSITWTGEKLVAVGDSGMVCRSDDGILWEKKPMIKNLNLISVIWAKDKIWLLADTPQKVNDTILDTILYVSNDAGVQWTGLRLFENMGNFVSICNNDSIFVVAGGWTIASSPDGITWNLQFLMAAIEFPSSPAITTRLLSRLCP